jgi:alkylmercury lyase
MDTPDIASGRQLAAALTSAFSGAPGAADRPWLWQPLLRLLAHGEPVTAGQLAQATGRSEGQVRQALAALPDTEYDSLGRVVGSGIWTTPSLVETRFSPSPLAWVGLFPTVPVA